MVEEIPDDVETKVKEMATLAARKAVRCVWNDTFSQAVEKEIKHLCSLSSQNQKSIDEPQAEKEFKTEQNTNQNVNNLVSNDKAPEPEHKQEDPEMSVSNNLNQINEEKGLVEAISKQQDNKVDDDAPISEVGDNSNNSACKELDTLFLRILDTFVQRIAGLARDSTEYILEVSTTFLDDRAKNALVDVHNLYFGNKKTGGKSANTNTEINEMIDNLQNILEEGKEGEGNEINRLSLAGLQKRLELIIKMDAGIKEKLIPILHSMQFEDFLNQRLTHIQKMWTQVIESENNTASTDLEQLKEALTKYPSSVEERTDFYRIVLKKDPPEEPKKAQSLVDILF